MSAQSLNETDGEEEKMSQKLHSVSEAGQSGDVEGEAVAALAGCDEEGEVKRGSLESRDSSRVVKGRRAEEALPQICSGLFRISPFLPASFFLAQQTNFQLSTLLFTPYIPCTSLARAYLHFLHVSFFVALITQTDRSEKRERASKEEAFAHIFIALHSSNGLRVLSFDILHSTGGSKSFRASPSWARVQSKRDALRQPKLFPPTTSTTTLTITISM